MITIDVKNVVSDCGKESLADVPNYGLYVFHSFEPVFYVGLSTELHTRLLSHLNLINYRSSGITIAGQAAHWCLHHGYGIFVTIYKPEEILLNLTMDRYSFERKHWKHLPESKLYDSFKDYITVIAHREIKEAEEILIRNFRPSLNTMKNPNPKPLTGHFRIGARNGWRTNDDMAARAPGLMFKPDMSDLENNEVI